MSSSRYLLFHEESREGLHENSKVCKPLYYGVIIPVYGGPEYDEYLLILSALELLLILSLLIFICRKKYYMLVKHDTKKAKAILLPYYNRIIYFYSFITGINMFYAVIQYIFAKDDNLTRIDDQWYMLTLEAISSLVLYSLEMFIVFLLMQTSVGNNAFKRARNGTGIIMIFYAILFIIRIILSDNNGKWYQIWDLFDLIIHFSMLLMYILIYLYVFCYHQRKRQMKRKRNTILYKYIAFIILIHLIFVISDSIELSRTDGWCFTIIGLYLYRIIFPVIAFITIKNDSLFWKSLIYSLQITSNTGINNNDDNDDDPDAFLSGEYRNSIKSIFGDHRVNKQSFYDPFVSALELEINMIDYDELHDMSDPFAMGTTAMVHKAMWRNQHVAVKKWIFDEIDLSLEYITEFFRETLFSNINHRNLVQFMGACLRPPELCLVYEYCNCGDLAHLLLTQYYSSSSSTNTEYESAKTMKNRLKLLTDIADGMQRLHDEDIIHRDLKTSNVLVAYDEHLKEYIAKVCDFGSARKLHAMQTPSATAVKPKNKTLSASNLLSSFKPNTSINNDIICDNKSIDNVRMTTQVGTIAFMAPELLSRIDISKFGGGFIDNNDNDNDNKGNNDDYQLMIEMDNIGDDDKKLISKTQSAHNTLNKFKQKSIFHTFQQDKLSNIKEKETHKTETFRFKYTLQDDNVMYGLTSLYDKSVDVFSFGIMMYECGFLRRVYDDMDLMRIHETITKNKRMIIPTYNECQNTYLKPKSGFYIVNYAVYESYVQLMQDCWAQKPEDRPKFHQIKKRLEDIEDIRKSTDVAQ